MCHGIIFSYLRQLTMGFGGVFYVLAFAFLHYLSLPRSFLFVLTSDLLEVCASKSRDPCLRAGHFRGR